MKILGDQFKVITGDADVLSKVPEEKDVGTVRLGSNFQFDGTLRDLLYLYEQARHKGTESAAVFYAVAKRNYSKAECIRLYSVFIGEVSKYTTLLASGGQDYLLADSIIALEDDFGLMGSLGYDDLSQLASLSLLIVDKLKTISEGPKTRAEITQFKSDVNGIKVDVNNVLK